MGNDLRDGLKDEFFRVVILFVLSLVFFLIFRTPHYIGAADEFSYTYLAMKIANFESPFMINELGIPTKFLAPRLFAVNLLDQIIPVYSWGWPIIFALFYGFFGDVGMFIANPIIGSLGAVFMYLLGARFFNRKIALFSYLFLVINPIYWNFVESSYSEVSSAVFVLIGLYFFLRSQDRGEVVNGVISALFLGYSVLIRYTNVLVFFSIFLVILSEKFIKVKLKGRWKLFVIYSAFLFLTVTVILFGNKLLFGDYFTTGYALNVGRDFQNSFSLFNLVKNLPFYLLGLLIEIPVLSLFVVPSLKSVPRQRRLLWVLTILISSVYILVYSAYPWLVYEVWNFIRFLLPIFPLLILFSTAYIFEKINWNKGKWVLVAVVVVSFLVGFVQLGAFKYTSERTALIGEKVNELTEPGSIVITYTYDKSIGSELYGNRTTIRPFNYNLEEFGPVIEELLDQGLDLYLFIDKGAGGMTEIRTAPKENFEDGWSIRYTTSYILNDINSTYELDKDEFSIEIRPFYPFIPFLVNEKYELYKIEES